jgi:nucleotide-binding universal stress UspA family protein
MKTLIAYDGSAHADAAIEDLRYAGLPQENEVLVVCVAHAGSPATKHSQDKEDPFASPWKACMKETEALAERARTHVQFQFPAWRVSSEGLWGEPANILHKTILRWMPNLIVMGSHGRSAAGRLFLGSISLDVVHRAPCSVRVVRTGLRRPNTPERLLLATDGSPQGTAAVDQVVRRFWPEGTQVRVISVAESPLSAGPIHVPVLEGIVYGSEAAVVAGDEVYGHERAQLQSVLDESVARLQAAGLAVSEAVLEGDARRETVAEANRWRADTVFVGARGLGALDRLVLGSVSTAIVKHAHCTVEVVRTS